MTELTIAERVAAGAAALDRLVPEWSALVTIERLDVSSPCRCILGQLYGNYNDAPGDLYFAPADRGFDVRAIGHDRDDEYAELTAEWKRLILARRAAVKTDA